MNQAAKTGVPINALLHQRWSPYAFDLDRSVGKEDLHALFEAARWMMSSYNAQPWRYIVGVRQRTPEVWEKVFSVLLEGNQPWAKHAPVLALGLAVHRFEHNGKLNKAAVHDLGAASAGLTVEAAARGLFVHQMIGIDPEGARRTFNIPDEIEPFTGLAIGYRGDPSQIPDTYAGRESGPRERKPLDEIIIHGGFDR
ncbi:MAG: nitroreductase family protein [Gammaproteobacteria bacterium]|nr:nitroreductase family protein [Gammaproteobacteria bacterium]